MEGEEDAWMDDLDIRPRVNQLMELYQIIHNNEQQRIVRMQVGGGEEEMTKEQVYEKFLPLLATDGETVIQALGLV